MRINLPKKVNILIQQLENCGHEAFAVGGCVRDSILGRTPNDWDLCTSATPEQMKECFSGFSRQTESGTCSVGKSDRPGADIQLGPQTDIQPGIQVNNQLDNKPDISHYTCKVIETGLQHGTLTVLLDGDAFEITTYRIDGDYSDGRHPDEVTFTTSLEADLARRDFTINAMAYNDAAGLVDPFGGQADLTAGILRCVGEPEKRFTEDSLRILRCVRFASQLGYAVENTTTAAMYSCLPLIDRVAAERIRVEFDKLLCGPAAHTVLRQHRDIIAHIIPEIRPMFDLDQKNAYHVYDVWEHTLQVLSHIPSDPVLRLAAFFHDIGKPPTMTVVPNDRYMLTASQADTTGPKSGSGFPEWGHFYGHEAAGAEITDTVLRRMKYDNATRENVCTVIDAHKIVFQPTARHARRLLGKLGEPQLRQLIQLELADVKSQNPVYTDERVANINAFEDALNEVLAAEQCFSLKHLAVKGSDLLELGVPQGREIGRILNILLDQVVEGDLKNDKAALLQAASKLL